MRPVALAIAVTALALLEISCASATACDAGSCPADQICDSARRCVLDVPPVVTITEPASGQVVNVRKLVVRGTVFDESGAATAELRVLPSTVWEAVSVAADGSWLHTVNLPLTNSVLTAIEVRASDPSAKQAVTQQQFFVDNAGPIASLTLLRSSGRVATNTALRFSEPIPGAPTITLSPQASGTWNDTRDQYLLSLEPNTAYTLTADPPDSLKDAAGNAAVELPTTFITEPTPPPTGKLVLRDLTDPANPVPIQAFSAFDAAADRDGVITLAVRYGGSNRLQWGRFSPFTGEFEVFQDIPASNIGTFRVHALLPRADRLDLRASVLVTTSTDATPTYRTSARFEGRAVEGSANDARLALPGTPCDPAATPAFGFVLDDAQGQIVARLPVGADLPVTLSDVPHFSFASPERWTLFNVELGASSNELRHQRLICECPAATCALSARTKLAEDLVTVGDPPSVASTADGRVTIALADRASDRAEVCVDCAIAPCATSISTRFKRARRVAVGAGANELIAAEKVDDVVGVRLFERRFAGCVEDTANQWTPVVDSIAGTSGIDRQAFRPLMVGDRPGLIYLNPASELHVFAAP